MDEKEYERWYKDCQFIKKELNFATFDFFLINARIIKYKFSKSNKFVHTFYKWYVYANNDLSINQKNGIWRYLHDDIELPDLFNIK